MSHGVVTVLPLCFSRSSCVQYFSPSRFSLLHIISVHVWTGLVVLWWEFHVNSTFNLFKTYLLRKLVSCSILILPAVHILSDHESPAQKMPGLIFFSVPVLSQLLGREGGSSQPACGGNNHYVSHCKLQFVISCWLHWRERHTVRSTPAC